MQTLRTANRRALRARRPMVVSFESFARHIGGAIVETPHGQMLMWGYEDAPDPGQPTYAERLAVWGQSFGPLWD